MDLQIDVETNDRSLSMPYFGGQRNVVVFQAGAAPVIFQGVTVRKGADLLSDVLKFVVDTSIAIEINLLAAWLYDLVKDRPETQIRIRRKIVERVTVDGIERVIREEISGPINRD